MNPERARKKVKGLLCALDALEEHVEVVQSLLRWVYGEPYPDNYAAFWLDVAALGAKQAQKNEKMALEILGEEP